MRRWLVRIAVVLAIVVLIVVLRLTVFRPDPVPVTVFIAARGRVEETVTNSKAGTVRTRHRARISPEIGGRVLEVSAKKGARVAAGQILARLDDTSYRTQVVNAERAFDAAREGQKQACIEAELAQRDLARAEGLAREKILSDELLDQARSRRDASAAACTAGRARTSARPAARAYRGASRNETQQVEGRRAYPHRQGLVISPARHRTPR